MKARQFVKILQGATKSNGYYEGNLLVLEVLNGKSQ